MEFVIDNYMEDSIIENSMEESVINDYMEGTVIDDYMEGSVDNYIEDSIIDDYMELEVLSSFNKERITDHNLLFHEITNLFPYNLSTMSFLVSEGKRINSNLFIFSSKITQSYNFQNLVRCEVCYQRTNYKHTHYVIGYRDINSTEYKCIGCNKFLSNLDEFKEHLSKEVKGCVLLTARRSKDSSFYFTHLDSDT